MQVRASPAIRVHAVAVCFMSRLFVDDMKKLLTSIFILFFASQSFGAWISPASTNNPSRWSNEGRAIDENPGNYATYSTQNGWGQYLEMYLPSSIDYVDKVKVKADFVAAYSPEVEIQLRVNSTWTSKYQGPVANAQWDEVSFSSENNVDAVRFRWRFTVNNWGWWLYEMYVWEGVAPEPPTCSTYDATSVNTTSANLHGMVDTDGGASCQYRFQYGTSASYGTNTSWTGSKVAGEVFGATITGLTTGQTYHFRAQVQSANGTGSGGDFTFSTGALSSGWVSPTSFSDGGGWNDEAFAYDDETSSYAWDYHDLGESQWNNFLTLILPYPVTSDKLRYYAFKSSDIDRIDVDISNGGGSWTNLYSGNFTSQTWETKTYSSQTVDRARVRFRGTCTNCTFNYQLFELDIYNISSSAPTLSWTGETNYSSDGLDPHTGYSDTDFEFRVKYTDSDNDGPSVIQVWVDRNGDNDYNDSNEKINLTVAADAAASQRDGDYTNGEIFSTTINITYGPNTSNCSYKFYANDGTADATGTPTTAINYPDVLVNPSEVSPQWSQSGLGAIAGGAIAYQYVDALYVARGTNVSAYNPASSGNQKWSYNVGTTVNTPSYIYTGGSYVILYSAGNSIYRRTDGGGAAPQDWSQNLGASAGNPYASPDGTTLYAVYGSGGITKRNLSNGNAAGGWTDPGLSNLNPDADIAVFNNEIYVAGTNGNVYRIQSDGTLLGTCSGIEGPSINLPLMAYGSDLFVTPDSPKLYKITTSSMSVASGFPVTTTAVNSGPAFSRDGNIYLACGTKVQKFADTGGSALWTYNALGTINSGPIVNNGVVYFGRSGGRYYALNDNNGTIYNSDWPYTQASGDADAGPWVDRDNSLIIFGTTGGNLDAFTLY